MKTIKVIHLYSEEKKQFVEDIYPSNISYVDEIDRVWAKQFSWYSWIWFKYLIWIKFKIKVRKSVLIYIG